MKKTVIICVCAIVIIIFLGFLNNIKIENTLQNADYLRIHIRANSNSVEDQNIKYEIKDQIVEFLTPKIALCKTKQDIISIISIYNQELVELANNLLNQKGFNYTAKVKIDSEIFPTRTYEGYTLESGVYDAIIVELGSATGNNWWCVVYPPLCFVNFDKSSQNIVYKSKIWEIIKQFFN